MPFLFLLALGFGRQARDGLELGAWSLELGARLIEALTLGVKS